MPHCPPIKRHFAGGTSEQIIGREVPPVQAMQHWVSMSIHAHRISSDQESGRHRGS